ncbi:hypothetical protein V8C86DRAFT_1201687 [Haematococcus lacustris]
MADARQEASMRKLRLSGNWGLALCVYLVWLVQVSCTHHCWPPSSCNTSHHPPYLPEVCKRGVSAASCDVIGA